MVNGIEFIEVGGNFVGNFVLIIGIVEVGVYVYMLVKGKGNDEKNWYLISKWDGVMLVDIFDFINNFFVVDSEGLLVYCLEVGSYISNIVVVNLLFSYCLYDCLGELQYIDLLYFQGLVSSMWMCYVGGYECLRVGDGQLNIQVNCYVLQLGGDLVQWSSNVQDCWYFGVMVGYVNQYSNIQSNCVGYKLDGCISGYSVGLYVIWYQNDVNKIGVYVDSWVLYNWFDNSVSFDNCFVDDYDFCGVMVFVEGGYIFEVGIFSGSEGMLNIWYVQLQV